MNEVINVTGEVDEIIFSNQENGYIICMIDSAEEGLFAAKGYMPYVTEGERVALTGKWINHPDYGEEFQIDYYETIMPTDEESIIKYLSSGIVKGIREITAKKLVKYFGTDIFDIMMTNPERLSEIKGISAEKAAQIGKAYGELRSVQGIVMFLQRYNVSANMAVRVHNALGSRAVDAIKENPYILSDRVEGIGFTTADTIAFNMGIPKNSMFRICAGIKHIMQKAAYENGHTYMPRLQLLEYAAYMLKVEEYEAESALSQLVSERDIVLDRVENTDVCYLFGYHEAEIYIARRLCSMANHTPSVTLTENEMEKAISEIEREQGTVLAPEQRDAVYTALTSDCMVITGGPGTGKTTITNTIIQIMESIKLSIALAAPTGRAAKRMSEVTGHEAKTIHRLLGTKMGAGNVHAFVHNETDPLTADVIILDEVSMVDTLLMASFLKAVKYGARLILVGDSDQLPSVGAGNVLRDIIGSGVVPVIKLTKIFRQDEESLIIVNAHRINRGEMPELTSRTSDFFFMPRGSANQAADTVAELYRSRLPRSYGIDPIADIQVLTPTRIGETGTEKLNKRLQNAINPASPVKAEHAYGKKIFRVGDKVMQIKNNYDMIYSRGGEEGTGIYNGDMGVIRDIYEDDKYMTVIFDEDKTVDYPFAMLDELELAYAITVHKSQGNEFPFVIMPVCSFSPMLMNRNILYTAVTRAKDMVILVGSEKTIRNMTLNSHYDSRFTGLAEKLCIVKSAAKK